MARIPIQSLVSARASSEAIQPGAFAESARATASLLGAVSGAADAVKKHFDRAQDLENRTSISEKKRIIRDSQGNFLNKMNGLQEDGNEGKPVPPSQWGELWKQELITVEGKLGLKEAPPVVSRAVGEDFRGFAGTSYIQISGEALKQNQRLATASFNQDYSFNKENGLHDANRELLREAAGHEVPEELVAGRMKEIDYDEKKDLMDTRRIIDVMSHQKDLEKNVYGLSDVALAKEKEATERQRQQQENEAIRGLSELMEADGIEDEDYLNSNLDSEQNKVITEENKEIIRKNYRSTKGLTDFERYEFQDRIDSNLDKLYTPNNNYGPAEYEDEWNKISADANALGSRPGAGHVRSNIGNVQPSHHSQRVFDAAEAKGLATAQKPVRTTANLEVKKRVAGLADIQYTKKVKDTFGGTDRDATVSNKHLRLELDEKEYALREAIQTELNSWISAQSELVTAPMIIKWLNENQKRLSNKAFDDLDDLPFGVIKDIETGEELAKEWTSQWFRGSDFKGDDKLRNTVLPEDGTMPTK